jgi:class 3 adenylate cyclase
MTELRTERKVVTVLFADLVGFTQRSETLDPEDVAAILRPYHERLRHELERFGGTVEKFIGDAVMALFGAPVAHEDDPERAVRAALAIRDWARDEEAVQVRVAVNTGEALINLGARPETGEGMAAGDVVNTTARLQSAAPVNGVLVAETTYRATKHVIDYRETASIEAKGKADEIPVWEAVEARARVGSEAVWTATPLVGRTRELDQLVDALSRARQDLSPQLVTLSGVPGIGKSRLVHELLQVVEADPEIILWRHGRSLPYGEGVTFWALAEMVKAQAGILESDAADDARAKLSAAVADVLEESDRDWIEAKLRPLVGVGGDEELGGDRRSESFAAWRQFFEALAATRPLVLVFEDLHWADDDLLEFVDELAEWVEGVPMLVVCTARPELLDRRPDWGGGKRNAVTISLTPLGDADTARLLAGLLDRAVLPAETQATLLARAGGNPLYAEQFARMIAERGAADGDLPETVQGIIAARLDALPHEEKTLLQDAAVLGKIFWPGALVRIGGGDSTHVDDRLRALARKEFIRRERRGSIARETEYVFGHILVRDVAYNQVPRAARAEKHRLAAQWIESLASDRSDDRAEMLAHHYLAALELTAAAGLDTESLVVPAREALREAAERASDLGAQRQAARLYAAALELWSEEDAEHPVLTLRLADARYEVGERWDVDQLAPVVERLATLGDKATAAEAEIVLAKSAWTSGRGALAAEHGERALALIAGEPPTPVKASVLIERARMLMLAREWERARELAHEGLAIAESLGLERLQASALITIGTMGHANVALERGLALALRTNDVQQIQRGYNNLAEDRFTVGEIAETMSLYEAARRSSERFGGGSLLLWLDAEEAFVAYMVGDWDRAARLADSFLSQVEAGFPHYQESSARYIRAAIRHARGDTTGALTDAERGTATARAASDPQMVGSLANHALLLLEEGRKQEAARLVDETVQAGGFRPVQTLHLALTLWALGRRDELLAFARKAELAKPWRDVVLALADGDIGAAANGFAALGARTQEAYLRLREAAQLTAEGRQAAAGEQLGRALAFYREVGATRYIREGEALLAASA